MTYCIVYLYFPGRPSSVDIESLAPHLCGFQILPGPSDFSCEEAIHLTYGMLVDILRCLLMPEIMHRGATEVFLHQ